MTFRWPFSRKNTFATDALLCYPRARIDELLSAERELLSIKRRRSETTRQGNYTKAANRRAQQAETTAALRGEA